MQNQNSRFLNRVFEVAAVTLLVVSFSTFAAAQDIRALPAGTRGGASGVAPLAMEVNLDAIPQASASELTPHMKMLRPRDGRTDAEYDEMKRLAARLAGGDNGSNGVLRDAGPAPAQRGAYLSTTSAFFAQNENGSTPSDMAVAAGPTYVVQFVNTAIAVYTKSGVLQSGFPKSATTFFGLPSGTYTTDPRGFYDWTNGRYVFVMLTESSFKSNNVGQLLFAVSATNNPLGSWHIFEWQVGNTGECPDYPTLGHDTDNWGKNGTKGAIYIGINQFANNCNGAFIQNYVFVIPKDHPYAGTSLSFWEEFGFNFGGTLVDTLQPSNPTSQGDRPSATYLTQTFNILWGCGSGCSNLGLWSVNNSAAFTRGGPGPTFTGVAVPTAHTYFYPPAANQPGHATSIETIDVRISGSMYYHAGDLFGTFDTGVLRVSGAHPIWFDYHPQLDLNGNITGGEERQEDCFLCGGQGSSGSAYFSTLIPDTENNLTMTYTFSDNSTYPEMAVTGRRVSYGDSLMNGSGFVIAGGAGFYNQFRWGDYSAVSPDNTKPASPLMWTAGDYDNSGNWGTAISAQSYVNPTDQ